MIRATQSPFDRLALEALHPVEPVTGSQPRIRLELADVPRRHGEAYRQARPVWPMSGCHWKTTSFVANPIEDAFARFKALLRKAAERSVDGGRIIDCFTHGERKIHFTAAGYTAS